MKKIALVLFLVLFSLSGANAYVYNFQPGPFPYPFPNTLDDYPNTAYCNYQTIAQPAAQYPSYRLEGVIVPYIQPNGSVIYFWSYQKMVSLDSRVQKVRLPFTQPPVAQTIKWDSRDKFSPPNKKYGWGKPF